MTITFGLQARQPGVSSRFLSEINYYIRTEVACCSGLLACNQYTLLVEPSLGVMHLLSCAEAASIKYLGIELFGEKRSPNAGLLRRYCSSHANIVKADVPKILRTLECPSPEIIEVINAEKPVVFFSFNVLGSMESGLDIVAGLLRAGFDVVISQFATGKAARTLRSQLYRSQQLNAGLEIDVRGEVFTSPSGFCSIAFDRSYLLNFLWNRFGRTILLSPLKENEIFSIFLLQLTTRDQTPLWRHEL
ncbi:hypothetical protein [Acetobacter senegalensis]|uniref:hypothetical protein n=1 Tax=Acetobacter senegalensis TaxID=446692 RepID=UPI00264E820A|nr:hypothetical protein [Acetobacter senegalensis]MDN7353668.1 hypothetical protein [Acetobacter senegalensis]